MRWWALESFQGLGFACALGLEIILTIISIHGGAPPCLILFERGKIRLEVGMGRGNCMGFSREVGNGGEEKHGPGPSLSSCCGHAFGSPAPTAIPPMHVRVRATVRQDRDPETKREGEARARGRERGQDRRTTLNSDQRRQQARSRGKKKRITMRTSRRRARFGNGTALLLLLFTFLSLHVSSFRVRLRLAIIQD